MLSPVLATRLKSTLNDIIHEDQTGFIKGRHMSENIRKVIEMIEYLEDEDISGLIMTIDFEKPFDKIEWTFIFKTLEYFDFGDKFIMLNYLIMIRIAVALTTAGPLNFSACSVESGRGVRKAHISSFYVLTF